ncbi:MAG: DUF4129 domain-containing protein [Cytophagales bacterium]|nr:DUF4129 domain-containing protein [Cytophagales bacterium]
MKHWLIFLFVCIIPMSFAQATSGESESGFPGWELAQRKFDKKRIEQFRERKDMQYETKTVVYNNFFQKQLNRFLKWLFSGVSGKTLYLMIRIVFYLLAAASLVVIVLQFTGTPIQGLFMKKAQSRTFLYTEEEVSDRVDFGKLLEEALSGRQWADALRYAYLELLNRLASQDLIIWKAEKTNAEYARELSSAAFIQDFRALTSLYERVWYGHFDLTEDEFRRGYQKYEHVVQELEGGRK